MKKCCKNKTVEFETAVKHEDEWWVGQILNINISSL